MDRMDHSQLLDFYRRHLLDDVIPFWMKHAVDREKGGLNTCLRDDGSLIGRDKYMWSQLRALWVFSKLYNRVEPRDEWLAVARDLFEFVSRFGRDEKGEWVFCVDPDGNVKEGAISIYADGFAVYGMTEFLRATGEPQARQLALETCDNVRRRLAAPGSYKTAPYEIPMGSKVHGIRMIFSLVFDELGALIGDETLQEAGYELALDAMDNFRRPDKEWLYEFIGVDNRLMDTPAGRCVVPGHAIECMWFMIHIFRARGERDRIAQAVECIRWHVEKGWDPEFGGLFLGLDAEGKEPVYWANWEKKIWWPITESLYALLLCQEYTEASWPADWYWRVHEYAFTHFPVREHGEWTQRLDRRGNPITELIALPVKDPFHLPRALIYIIDVLERLAGRRVTRPRETGALR